MDEALRHKLGQKFVVGFYGYEFTEEMKEAIRKYHFGNIILFRENLRDEEQTRQLCQELHDFILDVTGEAPIISVDQEGGMVTRLVDDSLNIPGAMALAATDDLDLTRRMNWINGRVLLDQGFNLNLAPVVDINNEVDNPVIGVRSFGDKPQHVAKYARASFEGLQEAGILASAKHFPGHGDTTVDSHVGLPVVDISREEMDARELVPFVEAAKGGIAAIMTTHILFPQIEHNNVPATMSRTILTDILREEIGFEGLIISDCMEMEAIATHYGTPEGVKAGFAAGVDLIFVSHTISKAIAAFELAYEAYAQGEISSAELDESVARVKAYKAKVKEAKISLSENEKDGYREEILATMPKTFSYVGSKRVEDFPWDNNTLVISPEPYRATNASNIEQDSVSLSNNLGKNLNIASQVSSARPDEDERSQLVELAKDKSAIILGLYNAHVFTEQLELLKSLRELEKPMFLVALRNPYDLMYLNADECGLSIFEYTDKSMQTLIQVLKGEVVPTGKLPVDLPERQIS